MILKRWTLVVTLFVLVFPSSLFAAEKEGNEDHKKDEDVNEGTLLLFDENTPRSAHFSFDIKESKRLVPKTNDFELIHFAPMSNRIGERWVLITVKNKASGHRFLKSEYIVATFANGDQANPTNLNVSVESRQVITKNIFFGVKKFPVVTLEMQP